MYKLDPSQKLVWGIEYFIRTILLSGFFVVINLIFLNALNIHLPINGWFITVFIFVAGTVISITAPFIKFNYWQFEIRQFELYIEHGFYNNIKTVAPFKRIQHLEVQQNAFERIFDLSKLVIYTAGTRGADIIIPGLPYDYAIKLRDSLKELTADDAL